MPSRHALVCFLFALGGGIAFAAEPPSPPAGASNLGAQVYEQNCVVCHYNGKGNASAPDLIGASVWSGGPNSMIQMILKGQSGVSVVNGKKFNGQMPAMAYLTDDEIAAVTAYVLKTFGNQTVEVSPASVAKLRAGNAPEDKSSSTPAK